MFVLNLWWRTAPCLNERLPIAWNFAFQMHPLVFDLRVRLIENRSRVVPKDELIEVVWRGRVMSDGSLNSRVNAARRAWGALTRSRR
jgi:DNA-binding winged helix-turn-helix (wHTH) protein